MGLEKESSTKLKVPKCGNPENNREFQQWSGMNLCKYSDARDCPYRVEVLTLHICEYEDKKSER